MVFVLKAIISFIFAYWLSAIILGALMSLLIRKMSYERIRYFIWIFISAVALSIFFNSISFFNPTTAILAAGIQTLRVTNKDNKFFIVALAFSMGWFLISIALLFLRS